MSKLFSWNALALFALAFAAPGFADVSGTPTLSANATLNLDTGTVGTSGGDILWTGTSIKFQGSATGFDLGSLTFSSLTQSELSSFSGGLSPASITPSVNDVIAVQTNGGNLAKVLVTAIDGTSVALQFQTFISPTIGAVVNNYSGITAGLPNYGIAPGSIFIIYGSDLSDPVPLAFQSSLPPGLPTTLNHTSISVTVNGVTTNPAILYAIPTQIAAVLPSTTPVGSGTITVNYNGQPTPATPIQVTASAFGLGTLNGAGSGGVIATDLSYHLITPTASAAPGQIIVLWGSGLGADTKNNDRTYPNQQDNLNNATVYIGGVSAKVAYAGRSQFPGVDQIDVTVPEIGAGFQGGCSIAVAVVAANIVSNFGTLPVNPGNGVCADAIYGINGSQLEAMGNQGTVKGGSLTLSQGSQPSSDFAMLKPAAAEAFTTTYQALANFDSGTGASSVSGGSFLSLGSCIVILGGGSGNGGTSNGLDAGSITLTGGGISTSLQEESLGFGNYSAQLTTALMGGTAYTFKGAGGKDVGPFSVTVTFPNPLNWTNESSTSTVTESQGQLITWTGGAPGTYVYISGASSTNPPSGASVTVTFACVIPVADQQFTIPSYVLEALPTGTGILSVFNDAPGVNFTATGIDNGRAQAGVYAENNVTYQ